MTTPREESRRARPFRLAIVQHAVGLPSDTFIRNHAEHLPATVTVVYGVPPKVDGQPILGSSLRSRLRRVTRRWLLRERLEWNTLAYLTLFRERQIDAVLAEYGPKGVEVMDACRLADIPLVVHFHGYDASEHRVIERYRDDYKRMFAQADAVIAVSRAMERRLLDLGADPERLHYGPYGADFDGFSGATPASTPPNFIAVGRFVEKKSPHLTLYAFSKVVAEVPTARLAMIGEGPLLGACKDLCRVWQIESAVRFLGARTVPEVQDEMRRARVFIQHSVEASSGDCEGTPVAIIEAGTTGLPVVSTRHAGIPDVVIDGETGLLVDEHDVEGMASAMIRLARDPELAAKLGSAARARMIADYSLQKHINRLWSIIETAHGNRN